MRSLLRCIFALTLLVFWSYPKAQTVTEAEFFFDLDPGFGNGQPIAIGFPDSSVSENLLINTSGLSHGFHTLYIRAKAEGLVESQNFGGSISTDTVARWGIADQRLVYVDPSGVGNLVEEVEYFVDNDPGYGAATPIGSFSAAPSISFDELIATGSFSEGFHTVFIRAKFVGGNWGIPEQRLIYVDLIGVVHDVAAIEYFFDDDPGYGSGTPLGSFSPTNDLDLIEIISTSSLSVGFHTLYIRPQVSGGNWGVPEGRLVYVDESGASGFVQELEYFFDDDPGYGAAQSITTFSPNAEVVISEVLDGSTLTPGFHTLYLRAVLDGGNWGIPEQRLVYVDQSGTSRNIDAAEYFFDTDPGYGLGTNLGSFATADDVDIIEAIDATSLNTGFHTLYTRVRLAGGSWGIPEQRLIFVSSSGNEVQIISALEYFFDDDPGFGAATPISIVSDTSVFEELFLAASALPAGEHIVGVRAQNQFGEWGHTETTTFFNFPPSRELDSVSLITFYQDTDGDQWSDNTNWLSSSIDDWYGVTVSNGRVESLDLKNNQLDGVIPRPLGFLDAMTFLDLSMNVLRDTVPESFQDLTSLVTLRLYDNVLDELPDLSGLSSLSHAVLDSNFFDFGDLEPLAAVPNVSYSNQSIINDFEEDSLVKISQQFQFDKTINGSSNNYVWLRNGMVVDGGTEEDLLINAFSSADTGTYVLQVTNDLITDLTLVTAPYNLRISDFEEDSLAMVSLYTATNGAEWSNNSNWLSAELSSWHGVNVQNNRVIGLAVSNNNLSGIVPEDVSYADSLIAIDLSQNSLMGLVPHTFLDFDQLTNLNVSGNLLDSIPSLASLDSLIALDVSDNFLQFDDLEANIVVSGFNYAPQKPFGTAKDTLVESETNVELALQVAGSRNLYQWQKGGIVIGGETNDTLVISNAVFDDEGMYTLHATSDSVPNLTLISEPINLRVSSLKRDSVVLRALYDATDGDNWTNPLNWKTDPIQDWSNISTPNNRVTEVDLAGNNLTDSIPSIITDITSLEDFDVSDNQLVFLPRMSSMPNLNDVDVSTNLLGFASLEYNVGIPNFTYSPQRPIGEAQTIKIPVDSSYEFSLDVSGTANEYTWRLNGNLITTTDHGQYTLESISFDSMGIYTAQVTNTIASDLTLEMEPQELLATADIAGQVIDLDETPLTSGGIATLFDFDTFDPIDTVELNEQGQFLFEEAVLGDYAMRTTPTDLDLFVSYYQRTNIWTEADEYEHRRFVEPGPSIEIAGTFAPLGVEEDVVGDVEEEFEDDGRVLGRRKVKRAGCSMRRLVRKGREIGQEFDLEFYTQTDDEGKFVFTDIPDGLYRINIDFPGVPMDPNSFIEFELGPSVGLDQIELFALVTDEGIVVEQTNQLGYRIVDDFNLYPNPADEWTAFSYTINRASEKLNLSVYDSQGNKLMEQPTSGQIGNHEVELDVSQWQNGSYFIIMKDESHSMFVQSRLLIAR